MLSPSAQKRQSSACHLAVAIGLVCWLLSSCAQLSTLAPAPQQVQQAEAPEPVQTIAPSEINYSTLSQQGLLEPELDDQLSLSEAEDGRLAAITDLIPAFIPDAIVDGPSDDAVSVTIRAKEKEYVFFVDEFRLRSGKPIFHSPSALPSALQIPDLTQRRQQLYSDYQSSLHVDDRLSLWGQFVGQLRLSDRHSDHKRVEFFLKWWLNDTEDLQELLQSAELYMFYVYDQVQQRGLPAELALLPFIESRFDPYAYSHASAAGLWQITKDTGKELGLTSNWWRQERRDIRRSTQAALDYLQLLNDEYQGDWLLALAAYNAGPGKVNRAIRRAGGKGNFWNLRLPQETRDYVPKLLALAQIVAQPQLYQFKPPFIPSVPRFAGVKTGKQIELAQAAALMSLDVATLYELNPQLNQLATDFAVTDTEILVPFELARRLQALLQRLPNEQRRMWLSYKRQGDESLTQIARRFDLRLQDLAQINDLRQRARYLLVPLDASNYERHAHLHTAPKPDELVTRDVVHRVKPGDSLWDIARAYDVSISQLELWNNISRENYLRLNAQLIIRKQSRSTQSAYSLHDYYEREVIRPVHYKVRRGDSLARIAARYDVNVEQIRDWNSSVSSSFIRPGQYLRLYLDVTELL